MSNNLENELWGKKWPNFANLAIHAGQNPQKWATKDIVPPITLATTYKQTEPGIKQPFYGRCGNPTRSCLEECIAAIHTGRNRRFRGTDVTYINGKFWCT